MKIEINKPLILSLDVIELDEHIPSMHIKIKSIINEFQYAISFEGNVWIDCKVWSNFTDNLNNSLADQATLVDMSEYFNLMLYKKEEKIFIKWIFEKKNIERTNLTNIIFCSEISDDLFARIRDEFVNFPQWW